MPSTTWRIVEAVGREHSRDEAIFAMQYVLRTQEAARAAGAELDSDHFSELGRAVVRLAECLKADFANFFQHALPPLGEECVGQTACVLVVA